MMKSDNTRLQNTCPNVEFVAMLARIKQAYKEKLFAIAADEATALATYLQACSACQNAGLIDKAHHRRINGHI